MSRITLGCLSGLKKAGLDIDAEQPRIVSDRKRQKRGSVNDDQFCCDGIMLTLAAEKCRLLMEPWRNCR